MSSAESAHAAINEGLRAIVRHAARNLAAVIVTVLDDVRSGALQPPGWTEPIDRARDATVQMLELLELANAWPAGRCADVRSVVTEVERIAGRYRGARMQITNLLAPDDAGVAASVGDVKTVAFLMLLLAYAALPDGGRVDMEVRPGTTFVTLSMRAVPPRHGGARTLLAANGIAGRAQVYTQHLEAITGALGGRVQLQRSPPGTVVDLPRQ